MWRRRKIEKEKEENIWTIKIFLRRRRRTEKEKEENILEKEKLLRDGTDRSKAVQEVLADLKMNQLLNFDK